MVARRCGEGGKGEGNTDFEVKSGRRVNWMMNDGRCMLSHIPLAELLSFSAHRSANVAAPLPRMLFQGYLSNKLCYTPNIPISNTHSRLAHPPHLFSFCRYMARKLFQLSPHYQEGRAISIQRAAETATAQYVNPPPAHLFLLHQSLRLCCLAPAMDLLSAGHCANH